MFEEFATLDLLSGGRAEIMAGRGSFTESFPLYGYELDDYDELFAEKLELLLALREDGPVTWSGRHRGGVARGGGVPPPTATPTAGVDRGGGTPASVARAGMLGLPLMIAIIGGAPARFAPLVELYREAVRGGRGETGAKTGTGHPSRGDGGAHSGQTRGPRGILKAGGGDQLAHVHRRHRTACAGRVLRAVLADDEPDRAGAGVAADEPRAVRRGVRARRVTCLSARPRR